MFVYKISNLDELASINPTAFALKTANNKAKVLLFKISNLSLSASHILKQEAISSGGDFIVSKDMILCKSQYYDGILIATKSQLKHIIAKCEIQPFNLKSLAETLQEHLKAESNFTSIMGVININDDSFYEDSRVKNTEQILLKINDMIESGVKIIDIGGVSSRPGSIEVEASIEIERIRDAVNEIYRCDLAKKAIFSIDSYNYETARFCVDRGFSIINDVYGLKDMRLASLATNSSNKIILMHNSWIDIHDSNIIQSVDEFFSNRLESLYKMGLKKEQIILDIGFGFGKTTKENIELIKNLSHFKHFGCELLVGASRKRSIGNITNKDTKDRLAGTLSLHQIALINGANIIRCHDYKEHIDMLLMYEYLK